MVTKGCTIYPTSVNYDARGDTLITALANRQRALRIYVAGPELRTAVCITNVPSLKPPKDLTITKLDHNSNSYGVGEPNNIFDR